MAGKKKDDSKKQKEDAEQPATENTQSRSAPQSSVQILAQYVKDISFENPGAPDSLRDRQTSPQININIEIGRQMLDGNTVEVTLMLSASAKRDGGTVFLCELEYAGLFAFSNMDAEQAQPLILVECPRLLFPFARQIMAELTQNGGFPPILLDPPDFAAMFREEMVRRAEVQGGSNAIN